MAAQHADREGSHLGEQVEQEEETASGSELVADNARESLSPPRGEAQPPPFAAAAAAPAPPTRSRPRSFGEELAARVAALGHPVLWNDLQVLAAQLLRVGLPDTPD